MYREESAAPAAWRNSMVAVCLVVAWLVAGLGTAAAAGQPAEASHDTRFEPTGRVEAFVDGRRVEGQVYECRRDGGFLFLVPVEDECLFVAAMMPRRKRSLRPRWYEAQCQDLAGECAPPRRRGHRARFHSARGLAMELGVGRKTVVVRLRSYVGPMDGAELLRDLPEYRRNYEAYRPRREVLESIPGVGELPLELTLFVGAPWCNVSATHVPRVMRVVDAAEKMGLPWKMTMVGTPWGSGPRGVTEAEAVGVMGVPALLVERPGGKRWCFYFRELERPEETLAGVLEGRIPPAPDQEKPCHRDLR